MFLSFSHWWSQWWTNITRTAVVAAMGCCIEWVCVRVRWCLLLLSFPLGHRCFIHSPDNGTTHGLTGCLCLFLDVSPIPIDETSNRSCYGIAQTASANFPDAVLFIVTGYSDFPPNNAISSYGTNAVLKDFLMKSKQLIQITAVVRSSCDDFEMFASDSRDELLLITMDSQNATAKLLGKIYVSWQWMCWCVCL